jgi:RNA polymerase sigma factor (sigma-70 family)
MRLHVRTGLLSQRGKHAVVSNWSHTVEAPSRRHFVAARANELDDLLTAVGATRDGQAFTELFDHFGPRVHAQMLRQGLAPFVAADVTQDVMETIWRKAHLFDRQKSAAATWVFCIAHNRRIDVGRRSRERSFAVEDFFDIPDPADTCDESIDALQREAYVHAALETLPQEQFALVHLAFFEGLSQSDIAERTRLPLGTVKSRLRLAYTRLRRFLLDVGVTEA